MWSHFFHALPSQTLHVQSHHILWHRQTGRRIALHDRAQLPKSCMRFPKILVTHADVFRFMTFI
ncbi:MAG: hypothetical protein BGN84_15730 [Afipia sp. 62-7]|nr:MAG: hypothetical protein BGN84_15730 [Afipia sp. 62-7]